MVAIASTLMNVKKRFEYRIRNDLLRKIIESLLSFSHTIYSNSFICLSIIIHHIIASIPFQNFGFIFIFPFLFSINEWRSIFDDVAWHIDASREIRRKYMCVGSISLCKVYPLKVNTRCNFFFGSLFLLDKYISI